jgi:hypothetical protein
LARPAPIRRSWRWKRTGLAGDIYFGTFDLGDNIVQGIKTA